ncbi:TatD family hydrolase [bacterium]|nr:TatD family hydrolase [candidate division CSSED10-310 bacterium]
MMTIVDTHLHLTDPPFGDQIEEIRRRSREAGIETMVTPGYSVTACETIIAMKQQYPDLPVAYGIHPQFIPVMETEGASGTEARAGGEAGRIGELLTDWLARGRPIAVGEIGLDSRRGSSPMERQQQVFREQLAVAVAHDLPVVIHCVQSHPACLTILTEAAREASSAGRRLRGVIHRASCSREVAVAYAALGMYFSQGPDLFDVRRTRLRALAEWVPDDRLLLETDGPYSVNRKGEPAGPWDLPDVAVEWAGIRGCAVEHIFRVSRMNTRAVFGI